MAVCVPVLAARFALTPAELLRPRIVSTHVRNVSELIYILFTSSFGQYLSGHAVQPSTLYDAVSFL